MIKHKKLAFVEDREDILQKYKDLCALHYPGRKIFYFTNPVDALRLHLEEELTGLVTDYHLEHTLNGHDLIYFLREMGYTGNVLMISAEPPHLNYSAAHQPEGLDYPYLQKPVCSMVLQELKSYLDTFFKN